MNLVANSSGWAKFRRIPAGLRWLKNKKLPGNTLVVSHSEVGRVIEATRINKSLNDIYELTAYPNVRVIELRI